MITVSQNDIMQIIIQGSESAHEMYWKSKIGEVQIEGFKDAFTVTSIAQAPFDPLKTLLVTLAPTKEV